MYKKHQVTTLFMILYLVNLSLIKAQDTFQEGIIVYNADSVFTQKSNKFDKEHREIRLYKKKNLYRLEIIKRSISREFATEIEVQIINEKGKYFFKDSVPSLEEFAFFITPKEEEKLISQRSLYGQVETYKVQEKLSRERVLDTVVERVNITNNDFKLQILLAINVKTEFGSFFEPYRKINGTPFLFYDNQGGFLVRYVANRIVRKEVPDSFFQMKSNYRIINFEELGK